MRGQIFGERQPFFEDLKKRTAQLRGSYDGIFETGFSPDGSHRPYFVTRPVALWLERQLDFPNWTEAEVQSMPETHISEWARKNQVDMDPFYANEEREGGIRALGADVPALSREQLSVFTEAEWNREKKRMIFETWLRHAEAAIGSGER